MQATIVQALFTARVLLDCYYITVHRWLQLKRLTNSDCLTLFNISSIRITGIVTSYSSSPCFDSYLHSPIAPLALSFIHLLPGFGLHIRRLSVNMFFCGSDYRFHFEIVVVLVIALIIYVFMSIAWIVGQSLWRIQEKVNRHEFTIADRKYASQPCQCQRTTLAICTDDGHLKCGDTCLEKAKKWRKKLEHNEEEVEEVYKKLKTILGDLEICSGKVGNLKDGEGLNKKDSVQSELQAQITKLRNVKDTLGP